MTESLFRVQALEAQRCSWVGAISIAQPMRLRVLAISMVAAAILVVALFATASYTRRSHVQGQLVAVQGMSSVLAPAAAVVAKVEVAEGSRVAAGQTLAVVRIPRATVEAGDTAQALEARLRQRQEGLDSGMSAQEQMFEAQRQGLVGQLRAARVELGQLEQQIHTRAEQVRLGTDMLARLERLREGQYVSDLQVKQQRAQALDQQAEVQALQRQRTGVLRLIVQLEQAVQELPGQRQASHAIYTRERAALEQEALENSARGELVVRSPVAGIVATQLFKTGQAVQAGQPMFTVLPGEGLLEAELLVPSAAIGFVEPGDKVLLRYQAYPYQKFGHHLGQVGSVSRDALNSATPAALISSGQRSEPYYRVSVALAKQHVLAFGDAQPLKPGMVLEADILGEKRKLIEWVFEPLYSLRGRLGED